MSEQLTLLATTKQPGPAQARRSDPFTSHQAAADVERSGKANTQRHKCLLAVVTQPGRTAGELSVSVGMDRHTVSKRLPELEQAGIIARGKARTCEIHGTTMLTWFLV